MIAHLSGQVLEATSESMILSVGGVGYLVSISESTYRSLPTQKDQQVHLWTHMVWREQTGPQLYGFLSQGERQLFEVLLGLNGVGPKTALAMVGALSVDQLLSAVQSGDLLLLTRVPGIGKKTAERLLSELKGRLTHLISVETSSPSASPIVGDAVRALTHLGYPPQAAERAVRAAAQIEAEDLSKLISSALQQISSST
jgi:holliday junction DNA helicase RuvA